MGKVTDRIKKAVFAEAHNALAGEQDNKSIFGNDVTVKDAKKDNKKVKK